MSVEILISLIVFLPLLGGISDFLVDDKKRFVSIFFTGGALFASIFLVISLAEIYTVRIDWTDEVQLGILLDRPSTILLTLVCLISFLVNIFSLTYMESDQGAPRYFAKLGFFTFSMLGLVVADSFILFFVFWELVGFASYLLIGFWFYKDGVASSARTAFMVNRVADVVLFVGILILSAWSDSLFISEFSNSWLFLPSLLITIGAFGKSAQVPFSGWLSKAMVGPIPISALIHAATMVAAGVYLLYRVAPFLHADVMIIISVVGAVTTLYGGISAINQNDIKKVLAYSTISQLGFMMIGIGVGAKEASLFHLFTHAFFKAGLFLSAGSIIHYLKLSADSKNQSIDSQDLRLMGGLRRKLPWTFRSFLICGLALAGIPFFSGFMSKEGIILASLSWAELTGDWAYLVYYVALISVLITAFYITRLIVLVFWGESRAENIIKNWQWTESVSIKFSLSILAIGCIWIFYNLNPLSHNFTFGSFYGIGGSEVASTTDRLITIFSITLSIGGLLLAFFLFQPGSNYAKSYSASGPPISIGGKLIYNGFYLTSFYRVVGVSVFAVARSLSWVEKAVIDGFIHFIAVGNVVLAKVLAIVERLLIDGVVNLFAWLSTMFGRLMAGSHSREAQWQIIWLLLAFVLILSWLLLF